MSSSVQHDFLKDYEFSRFPELPTEIRMQIWKICVLDNPARNVDLREDSLSPTSQLKSLTTKQSQNDGTTNETRSTVGFRSRASPLSVLHICQDSRMMARMSYTKAFGTAGFMYHLPSEIWIDYNKDALHLSLELCEAIMRSFNRRTLAERVAPPNDR